MNRVGSHISVIVALLGGALITTAAIGTELAPSLIALWSGALTLLFPSYLHLLARRFGNREPVGVIPGCIGLGACLIIVTGLMLHFLPGLELDRQGWLMALSAWVTIMALLFASGEGLEADDGLRRRSPSSVNWGPYIVLVPPLIVLIIAVMAGHGSAVLAPQPTLTQLWAYTVDGSALLGVLNLEGAPKDYTLSISSDDAEFVAYRFSLDSGARWETSLPSTVLLRWAGDGRLDVTLHLRGEDDHYRHVVLTPAMSLSEAAR